MGKKSEKRQQRKAEKDATFEMKKAALIERVVVDQTPIVSVDVQNQKIPNLAPHLAREKAKQPQTSDHIGSRFPHMVTWCRSVSDIEGQWTWGEPRMWLDDEWHNEIHPKFMEFSKLTWAEVDHCSSDSGHKMHHSHDLDELTEEAQERWFDLELGEFADSVFRFRLEGTKRAWGYILQTHFHLVWWERYHKIYPVD